jgi:hypothetical protein
VKTGRKLTTVVRIAVSRGREDRNEGEDRRRHRHQAGPDAPLARLDRREDRPRDLGRRMIDDLQAVFLRLGLLEMPQQVLGQDHPHVDHGADGDRDPRQRDDVGIDAERLHRDEAAEYGQRKKPGVRSALTRHA